MKALAVTSMAMLVLLLVACGGGYGGMSNATTNASGSIDGNWTTTMLNQSGAQMMVFSSAISHNGTYMVTATNIQFTMGMACFATGASATGSVMPNGNMNSFGMTIQSSNTAATMGNTVLTLQGSMTNANTVSGTWMMNSITSGCGGTGTFTMTRM
jgi:hypothetical protein